MRPTRDAAPGEEFPLRRYVDLVEAGRLPLKIHQVSAFDEIAEAHRVMEAGEPVVRVS